MKKSTMNKESYFFNEEITDHGDFSEGYCFQIKSLHWKKKTEYLWELCSDSRVTYYFTCLLSFLYFRMKRSCG